MPMSAVSQEPSDDLEVPTEDAIEQHQSLAGDEEKSELEDFELPDEADPADVVEQHEEVADDEDEDAYR
jgi:hypothetical protein